jgi:hypothetical protein
LNIQNRRTAKAIIEYFCQLILKMGEAE